MMKQALACPRSCVGPVRLYKIERVNKIQKVFNQRLSRTAGMNIKIFDEQNSVMFLQNSSQKIRKVVDKVLVIFRWLLYHSAHDWLRQIQLDQIQFKAGVEYTSYSSNGVFFLKTKKQNSSQQHQFERYILRQRKPCSTLTSPAWELDFRVTLLPLSGSLLDLGLFILFITQTQELHLPPSLSLLKLITQTVKHKCKPMCFL